MVASNGELVVNNGLKWWLASWLPVVVPVIMMLRLVLHGFFTDREQHRIIEHQ